MADNAPDAFDMSLAPPAVPPAAPAGPDPFDASLGSQIAAPTPAASAPSILENASAGVIQGARNVVSSLDPVAQWLDQHVGSVTLGGLLPTAAQAHANNLTARTAFNKKYGNSTTAQIGQDVGEVAASLPAMAAGGEVLGPLAAAASRAAPVVAPAVDFLAGTYKGNKLMQLASKAALGAGQGAYASALTSGGSDVPLDQQLEQGAALGGTLATAIPAAAGAGSAVYNKLTGGGVNPATAQLATKAVNKYGIPLRGSQISNSPFMRYLDSNVGKMPFSGLEAQNEAQKTAFTKAVASTMGSTASDLTPQTMSKIRSTLSNNYNQVAARTSIPVTGPAATGYPLQVAFGNTISEASRVLSDPELKPLQNQVAHILGSADPNTGAIPGDVYKALTAEGSSLDRLTQSKDPNVRHYAGQIEKSLNDALTANASPQDAALLKQTNLQWKNMRTVQDLAAKAGIEGEISPSLLLNAVKKSYKDMAYSGAGQIGDLADIGQRFLKEPPSSGTGERAAIWAMLGAGSEAGVASLLHDPNALLHTAATGAGLLGAGRLIGAGLKSNLYRNALLRSVSYGKGGFTPALGVRAGLQTIGQNAAPYAIPAGVIVGNNLRLQAPPQAVAP